MDRFTHDGGRHLTVAGARIYVEIRGNPDGAPLVFLPGGFGDIEDYDSLTRALAPDFRLVGIDSRGHGASTLGDAPLTYARLQADVEAVCRSIGLAEIDVIGFSDGGIVGLRLAVPGPLRIRRLVAIGAQWALPPDDPSRPFLEGITAAQMQAQLPRNHATYLRVNPEPDFPALTAAIRQLWLDAGPDGYPGEAIRRIACPLLVVRGDEDAIATRSHSVELADRVAGARFLNLPYADHAPHWDQPDLVAAVVGRFLRDPAPPPGA